MRNIVRPALPSPGSRWMLNTAFARAVPSGFLICDTYDAGTGLGGFGMPDRPSYVQFALVCVRVAVHVTVNVDSFTRGPPAGTSADSSKFLPVAVNDDGLHEDVPPPNVMPGRETSWAVVVAGPSSEHVPWGGTSTVTPALVNEAEPMLAMPGAWAACAGATAANESTAVTIVVRIPLSSSPPESGLGGRSSSAEYPPAGDVRCARNLRSPFRGSGTTREVMVGGVMFVTVSAGQRVNDDAR
ncbi:hypothetical protein [Amycolatopsis sp. NPDC051102]|uniref:hypothetical protein n=1 Tax=Amycolatopsis sp. NPDC051102 TaxID=3155163 RepID=UPI0034196474